MDDSSRRRDVLVAAAVAVGCAALLVATSAPLPLGWDEGDTIARAELLDAAVRETGLCGAIGRFRDPAHWPFTTAREGHPPLAYLLVAAGQHLAPAGLDPLARLRFGPMVLFGVAAGALYYRLARDFRAWPVGLTAVAVLVSMPRMFAHAHFATLDAPLAACWVLAWAAFAPATRRWRYVPLFALALGLTLSAKFTGWLAPVPFAAWSALYRHRGGCRALAVALPLAVALFVLLNPPLWSAPFEGLARFFELNAHRRAQPGLNVSTQFFGRMYNLDYPLPWYNTLVWTAITVSPLSLAFGILGLVASLRRWRSDRAALLVVLSWATLIAVRALPWAPPHDAERLWLPAFAFFAALAGVGAGRALYRDSLLAGERIIPQGWARVGLTLALAAAALDACAYFPHGLSYYNRLIGGLRGATALGMEATYYWDALDGATLDWLAQHTRADEKIAFAAAPPRNLELLVRWGRLARLPDSPGTFRWYVLQRRASALGPAECWLIEHAHPAHRHALAGVPLVEVYAYADYERACAQAADAFDTAPRPN